MKIDSQNVARNDPATSSSESTSKLEARSCTSPASVGAVDSEISASKANSPLQNPQGWVYLWHANPGFERRVQPPADHLPEVETEDSPGWIVKSAVPLPRLTTNDRLAGQFVEVHNAAYTKRPNSVTLEALPLGDAIPDPDGNFYFEPYRGGGRMERYPFTEPEMWERYISASRFGEVNAYYHTDRVAAYVDGLLRELGYPSLPPVIVKVNAHNAIAEIQGEVDGVRGKISGKWYPFQGGHYRLTTRKRMTVREWFPVVSTGEIHLGAGWKLARHGALAQRIGEPYRCNAAHNAGTIYHEYGHHVTRHTADFRANHLRDQRDQCNYKTDVDEAFCDYLAATMMGSPHIWAFHHQHNSKKVHRRSLTSSKSMDDYLRSCSDSSLLPDAHDNGTILAAALWDLRTRLVVEAPLADAAQAIHDMDLMVIHALVLIGQITDHPTAPTVAGTCRLRKGFGTVRQALLHSDQQIFSGRYSDAIRDCFRRRKIVSRNRELLSKLWSDVADQFRLTQPDERQIFSVHKKCRPETIPAAHELLTGSQLEAQIQKQRIGPYSLIAVGDVMIGSRARKRTNEFGPDYIFHATRPLFRRASIVLANQEGPIARHANKLARNFSYKVSPKYTRVLRRAGFNVLTLANNHLLDCGREGVLETLKSLEQHGIHAIGVGANRALAHQPAIMRAGQHTIGLLAYYWNRRTAAQKDLPGSAIDSPRHLEADIRRLRRLVDRVVITVHWGVPYERQPSDADREKAAQMISLGADLVIGHHPHIIQEVEIIEGRPVLYSLGNFAFGTGNSNAESLLVGVDFRSEQTVIDLFPAYVRNRDPRVNYQPKILTGAMAKNVLENLRTLSRDGQSIQVEAGVGKLVIPYRTHA